MGTLDGKVALVAGGTRGAGRGIAVELGSAGATVYVTGRSVRGRASPSGRPETIDETAELVSAAGGVGIPIRVDHTLAGAVQTLIERIANEQDGRLDILVNDVWGGDELTRWGVPFWEHDLDDGLRMQQRGLHSHVITSTFAAPLLIARGGGVLFEITDGTGDHYRGNVFYDLVKSSVVRLAFAMAEELRPHRVAALAVTPGFVRSEAVLERFGVTEENWASAANPDWVRAGGRFSETPRFVGRALAALAADPGVLARSGTVVTSAGCAREYRLTDVDGTQPDWDAAMRHRRDHDAWPDGAPRR